MQNEVERALWSRIQDVFHLAADLPPDRRDAFLFSECGGDRSLESRVRELLLSLTESDQLEAAIRDESHMMFEQPALREGERIGAFCVGPMLGHGGMGNVYAGTRDDGEYSQQVAIKLVRPEIAGAEILRRFRAERQILAGLNNPHIARLLDGGITGAGLPYLVMEFVDGVPIDEYCRERNLSIRDRLVLFREVCAAVQYAHRNLVIHRDLKPSNILVTREGTAKLLDFGIAKLLSTDDTIHAPAITRLAERPMTLDYASPEQVRGEATSTATDIFALGTLLYELLSGRRPYQTSNTHPVEAQRRICEVEPPRPSSHNRLLDADLDDVVGMAIRKEPQARYPSVERFSADIQNFLDGFPVEAAKGNARYRTVKFIKRHRLGVGLAVAAVLLLSVFAAGMGILAVKYARERDLAQIENSRAEQVTQFLTGLFRASDPFRANGRTVTARELLDAGAQGVGRELRTQPAVRVRVLEAMGLAYEHLGVTERAESLYSLAADAARSVYGGATVETARQLRYLGDVQRQQGKLPEAEKNLRSSLSILELKAGNEDEKSNILNNLGLVLQERGMAGQSEELFRRAIQLSGRYAKDPSDTLTMKSNLGGVYVDLARYREAERIMREVLEERRRMLGNNHPQVYRSMQRLAHLLELSGSYKESEDLSRTAKSNFSRLLGEEHPDVLVTSGNLAVVLQETGRTREAEALLRFSLDAALRKLPPTHVTTLLARVRLGSVLTQKGEWEEAEQLLDESVSTTRNNMQSTVKNASLVLSRYGRLQLAKGNIALAGSAFEEALSLERKRHGEEHPTTADIDADVGSFLASQKRYGEAEIYFKKALLIDRKLLPGGHLQTASHLLGYAKTLRESGRSSEAEPLAREAFSIRSANMNAGTWPVKEALAELRNNR